MKRVLLLCLAICASLASAQRMQVRPVSQGDQRLSDAVRNDDLARVRALIKSGISPNSAYANGWPILIEAIQGDKPHSEAIVEFLVKSGADVNGTQPDQGWTPLITACSSRQTHLETVKFLIEHGANVNVQMPGMGTSLHAAVRSGRQDLAEYLLAHGADLEAHAARNPHQHLGATMWTGPSPEMKTHMTAEERAQSDKEDENLAAMDRAQRKWTESSIEPGYEMSGRTPLIEAAAVLPPKLDTVNWLLSKGAKVDATDDIGRTALHEACFAKSTDVVKLLLDKGAKANKPTQNGYTPLHIACQVNALGYLDPTLVQLLIERGADVKAKTNAGKTARDLMKESAAAFEAYGKAQTLQMKRPENHNDPKQTADMELQEAQAIGKLYAIVTTIDGVLSARGDNEPPTKQSAGWGLPVVVSILGIGVVAIGWKVTSALRAS